MLAIAGRGREIDTASDIIVIKKSHFSERMQHAYNFFQITLFLNILHKISATWEK